MTWSSVSGDGSWARWRPTASMPAICRLRRRSRAIEARARAKADSIASTVSRVPMASSNERGQERGPAAEGDRRWLQTGQRGDQREATASRSRR